MVVEFSSCALFLLGLFLEVSCVGKYNQFYLRIFYRKQNLNFHFTKTSYSSYLNLQTYI